MPVISSLVVELKLMAENFNNGIKSAQKEAKELEKTIKPTKIALEQVGTAAAAAGVAVGGALLFMSKQAADYGDAIRDAAIRTNTTTQEMAAFKYLAEQSGTSVEALQKGLTILSKNAFAGADAFKRLGIDTRDSNGQIKSSKDLFAEVSEKLSTMKDGTAKTGIELALFGKSATQLQEALNGGKAAVEAATAATERFGTAIGPEAAAAADKFNDTLNDMEQAQLGLSLAVGSALIPTLTSLAETVTNVIVTVQQWTNANPGLVKTLAELAVLLTGAGGLFLGFAAILAILPQLTAAWTALNVVIAANPIGAVIVGITALVAALVFFRNEIAGGVAKALSFLVRGLADVVDGAYKLAGALGLESANALSANANAIRRTADNLDDMSKTLLAAAPIVLDNTKAVNAYKQSHAGLNIELGKSSAELKKAQEEIKRAKDKIDDLRTNAINKLVSSLDTLNETNRKVLQQDSKEFSDWLGKKIDGYNTIIKIQEANTQATAKQLDEQQRLFDEHLNAENATYKGLLDQRIDAADDWAKRDADILKKQQDNYKELFNSVKDTAKHAFLQMFEDGKFHFSALADVVKGIFETLWTEILSNLTAQLLTPLVGKISGALSSVLGKIPGLGGVFGGATSAAGSAAGGAGSAAGSIGGAVGGGFSLAGSLLTGGLSALGGLAGGILGNDRGAQRETAFNTGATHIVLKDTLEQVLWPQYGLISFIADQAKVLGIELIPVIGYWSEQVANVTSASADRIIVAIEALGAKLPSGSSSNTTTVNSGGADINQIIRSINNQVQFGGARLVASEVR